MERGRGTGRTARVQCTSPGTAHCRTTACLRAAGAVFFAGRRRIEKGIWWTASLWLSSSAMALPWACPFLRSSFAPCSRTPKAPASTSFRLPRWSCPPGTAGGAPAGSLRRSPSPEQCTSSRPRVRSSCNRSTRCRSPSSQRCACCSANSARHGAAPSRRCARARRAFASSRISPPTGTGSRTRTCGSPSRWTTRSDPGPFPWARRGGSCPARRCRPHGTSIARCSPRASPSEISNIRAPTRPVPRATSA